MNVKVDHPEQHKATLTIEIPAEAVQKGFKEAVARIANQVKIPGFRKGKASRIVLERRFGKEVVAGEAEDIVINRALNEALAQEKIIPVTTPDVKQEVFSEKEGARFVATFVKQPEVELGNYKGLEAEQEKVEIDDAQVMAQLTAAAEQNSRLEQAEEGAKLGKGDFAVIDFKGFVDGKPFAGGEGKTYPLEIGSQSFIPGFEEQLEGHIAGDDVTVKVTFPESYFVNELAGKEAEFEVHVNDVKRKAIPALDDDFAKSVSQYETMEDLKASVKQQMQLRAMQEAEEKYHEALIAQAVANAKLDIPQEMVHQRIDEIVGEVRLNMEARNSTLEDYLKSLGKTEADFRKDYETVAAKEVRQGLVLGAIADKEELQVTDQDLSMEVYSMARQFNADPKDVIKIIKDEGRVNMLINSVRRKKAAAFIYGAAVRKEVEAEAKGKEAEEKPAEKKAPAKKPAAKKTTTKKTAAKKEEDGEKKPAAKKTPAKKPAAKKTTAKKTTAKKEVAKDAE